MNKTKMTRIAAIAAGIVAASISAQAQTLVDQWNFNETSGTTAANSVGGGASASLMSGATFNGSGQAVLNGSADGSGNYVDLGNSLSGLTSVTLECWFDYTQANSRAPLITGMGSASFYYLRYSLYDPTYQSPNAYLEANNSWGGGGTTLAQTGAPAQNTLEHVAIVYDPANNYQAIYVNGSLAASATGALLGLDSIAGSDLVLGKSVFGSDPTLTGTIDQFSIYNGAVSGTQIAADFASGPVAVPEPSTMALGLGGLALAGLFRRRFSR